MAVEVVRRSGNPALNQSTFEQWRTLSIPQSDTMSLSGTVNKTGILLFILVACGSVTWKMVADQNPAVVGLILPGALLGFITALVTIFKKEWSPMTAPLYAALEGLVLGGISALYNAKYPGIVSQAVILTIGVLFTLLAAYRSGVIKATENFKLGVVAATGGIFILYLGSFLLSMFGVVGPSTMLYSATPLGIGISAVVCVVAALNLVLDFDFIERGCESGAPKFMEWYGAFGLMVTLIWLYLEILRLLSKLRER